MQQGWLIPLALVMFLAFAFADCRSPEPLFPVAPPVQGRNLSPPAAI
jgi:hypothetical protein